MIYASKLQHPHLRIQTVAEYKKHDKERNKIRNLSYYC